MRPASDELATALVGQLRGGLAHVAAGVSMTEIQKQLHIMMITILPVSDPVRADPADRDVAAPPYRADWM